MAWVSTFKRDAPSRSTSTLTWRPLDCWSEATSTSSGRLRSTFNSLGAHSDSSSTSAAVRVYWYWVRLIRLSICTSWAACMKREMPWTESVAVRKRAMIWSALAWRLSREAQLRLEEDNVKKSLSYARERLGL